MLTSRSLNQMFNFCRKVSDVLVKEAAFLECQCWRNVLFSRRESAEIISMSNSILHSALEKTVSKFCNILELIFMRRNSNRTTTSTKRRRSGDSEISRRKDCQQIMRVKKELKDLNPTHLDFPEGTQLFINDSLCQKTKTTTETKQTKTEAPPPPPPPPKKKRQNKTKKIDPLHFSDWFFTCSLPVSSSKFLEHNPFTLLKFYYLLNAIFHSKSNCFYWVV